MLHFLEALFDRPWLERVRHFPGAGELADALIGLSSAVVDPGSDRDSGTPHGTEQVLR